MDSIDLKHMRIFVRLVREGSASKVALETGMSQQAISAYLKRLRHALPQEIFLRHSNGLQPTDFAQEIARRFERILDEVDGVLLPEVFDPKTVSRCVGIVANEYAQLAILPKFAARLRDEAPGIRIRVLDFHAATHAEQLAKGEAEVVIGFSAAFDDALPRTSLREERYCCVVGGASQVAGRICNAADVGRLPRVDFVDSASYSRDSVSQFLLENGALSPPVATLACYTSLSAFLEFNDVVSFVPEAVAEACLLTQIDRVKVPQTFTVAVGWHRRTAGNALGTWLGEVLMGVF
ncbi:LysR family transcriptional regulator [Pandoraea capi]|uniref:LysR family transcriptional regulator n=1 Tax=Pandoraea TaxID=93217 RepID=UPI001F5DC41C|nr:LysR family transcriptional regulator [Pandoraea capi]